MNKKTLIWVIVSAFVAALSLYFIFGYNPLPDPDSDISPSRGNISQ